MSFINFINLRDDSGIQLKIKVSSGQEDLNPKPLVPSDNSLEYNGTILDNELYACLGIAEHKAFECPQQYLQNTVRFYYTDFVNIFGQAFRVYINNIDVTSVIKTINNNKLSAMHKLFGDCIKYSESDNTVTISNSYSFTIKITIGYSNNTQLDLKRISTLESFFKSPEFENIEYTVDEVRKVLEFCLAPSEKCITCNNNSSEVGILSLNDEVTYDVYYKDMKIPLHQGITTEQLYNLYSKDKDAWLEAMQLPVVNFDGLLYVKPPPLLS